MQHWCAFKGSPAPGAQVKRREGTEAALPLLLYLQGNFSRHTRAPLHRRPIAQRQRLFASCQCPPWVKCLIHPAPAFKPAVTPLSGSSNSFPSRKPSDPWFWILCKTRSPGPDAPSLLAEQGPLGLNFPSALIPLLPWKQRIIAFWFQVTSSWG